MFLIGMLLEKSPLTIQTFLLVSVIDRFDIDPFVAALLATQLILMGWVETKRWQEIRNPGSQADGGFLGITEPFKGQF